MPAALTGVPVLPPKGLNNSIYIDLNRFSERTAWAHGFMHDYALWLGPVLLAAVFVAAYATTWWRRVPRASAVLILGGIGTVAALGLNQVVGHAAKELRPYVSHPNALVLVAKTNDYSFPSDHSVVAGGLTVSIFLLAGRAIWRHRPRPSGGHSPVEATAGGAGPGAVRVLAAVNLVLGLFLCFARVYVGAHYPGDVVAGYLLGALVAVAVSLLRPVAYRVVTAADQTVLGLVLSRPAPPSPAAPHAGAERQGPSGR